MGLGKKNFLYSIGISLMLVVLITGYFLFMLPSLYEAHVMDLNYQSVVDLHKAFTKNGSYEGVEVRNPTGCVSTIIPKSGNIVKVTGMNYHLTITLQNESLCQIVNQLGNTEVFSKELIEELIKQVNEEKIIDLFQNKDSKGAAAPIKIDAKLDNQGFDFNNQGVKLHQITNDFFVLESKANDQYNQYIWYFAIEMLPQGVAITTLPVMAPKINEIRPVVLGSLPMISVVVFLLVLLFSQMYSRKIVNPIVDISHYTEEAMQDFDTNKPRLIIKSKDEIGSLAESINEMYEKLSQSLMELKHKNKMLAEENERQEVFLRASSHQLKTPIAAALLLTEGMIGEVGKYKDTKVYLLQVKAKLLSIKNIVDDVLYISRHLQELRMEEVDINLLTNNIVSQYEVQIQNKELSVTVSGEECMVNTDGEVLSKVLDNLISNAVNHTKSGEKITISSSEMDIMVFNFGSHINEELLPHIYEPFVSDNTRQQGHGLGLYVASYYAQILGFQLQITNEVNGVKAKISFGGDNKC